MKEPSKKTRAKRKKFANWIWENQIKPIVRLSADGKCELCGVSDKVKQCHCHHAQGRQSIFMLLHLDGLLYLCASHHTLSNDMAAHGQSQTARDAFSAWIKDYWGKERLEELERLRRNSPKLTLIDLEEVYEHNKLLLESLEKST